MFDKNQLPAILDIFSARKLYLYHACQLQDYYSYLAMNGIASRHAIQKGILPLTKFDTDDGDQNKGLWNLVFGNFNDFSITYHLQGKAFPNPYGPILIKIDSKALLDAEDLSITLRSAGAKNFSRQKESLTSLDDLNKIFCNSPEHRNANQVKFKPGLAASFPGVQIGSLEWSMNFPNGILPIEYFMQVIVDPITIAGVSLLHEVQRLSLGYDKILGEMISRPSCHSLFPQLISAVESGASSVPELKATNENLALWAGQLSNLGYQFERYAKYTREGTIKVFGRHTPPKSA